MSSTNGSSAHTVDVKSGRTHPIGVAALTRWSGDGKHIHYAARAGKNGRWELAQARLDGDLARKRVVTGYTWGFFYPCFGLAVDRCPSTDPDR